MNRRVSGVKVKWKWSVIVKPGPHHNIRPDIAGFLLRVRWRGDIVRPQPCIHSQLLRLLRSSPGGSGAVTRGLGSDDSAFWRGERIQDTTFNGEPRNSWASDQPQEVQWTSLVSKEFYCMSRARRLVLHFSSTSTKHDYILRPPGETSPAQIHSPLVSQTLKCYSN